MAKQVFDEGTLYYRIRLKGEAYTCFAAPGRRPTAKDVYRAGMTESECVSCEVELAALGAVEVDKRGRGN